MENLAILNIENECTACGACVSACPKNVLKLEYNKEGFYYPNVVNENVCITCHKCEKVCHALNHKKCKKTEKPEWWETSPVHYFIHSDKDVLFNSTSGGAMTALANHVIVDGGVLFATHYNATNHCLEFASTDDYPLADFRKSRYMESYTGTIFARVKAEIQKERKVMFVGTACQINALYSFLGRRPDNLLTVSFICHGVPSSLVFHEHIKRKGLYEGLQNVDFRYKQNGWHDMHLCLEYAQTRVVIPYKTDSYYLSFYQNDFLRKSCYTCNSFYHQKADITIADCWGVGYFKPEIDKDEGVSMLILHTELGQRVFKEVSVEGRHGEIPYSGLDYLLNERKAYDIKQRFYGNVSEYLRYMESKNKKAIWKYKTLRNPIVKKLLHMLRR